MSAESRKLDSVKAVEFTSFTSGAALVDAGKWLQKKTRDVVAVDASDFHATIFYRTKKD